jgi:hypothetical protein
MSISSLPLNVSGPTSFAQRTLNEPKINKIGRQES